MATDDSEINAEGSAVAMSVSAGTLLRETRESRGISDKDAADALRITLHYLRSIEADLYEKLPGAVFAKGYLRGYAQFLQLDVDDVLSRYEATVGVSTEDARQRKRPYRSKPQALRTPQSGPRTLPWVLASLIAFAMGFGGIWAYHAWSGTQVGQALPATAQRAPAAAVVQTSSPRLVEPAPTVVPPVATLEPVPTRALTPADVVTPGPLASDSRIIDVGPGGADRLEIHFTGDCWIEVRDGTREAIYSDLRVAGDVLRIAGDGPFDLLLGDAPLATVQFNGQTLDVGQFTRIDNSARLTVGR